MSSPLLTEVAAELGFAAVPRIRGSNPSLGTPAGVRALAPRLEGILGEQPPTAELLCLLLIHESYRRVIDTYEDQKLSGVFGVFASLLDDAGAETGALIDPADAPWVLPEDARPDDPGDSWREVLVVRLANENPAAARYRALYDDSTLEPESWERSIGRLDSFFGARPRFGPDHEPLSAMLRRPMREHPESLAAQLAYIRHKWASLVGELAGMMLLAEALAEEETAARIGGPGPVQPLHFGGEGDDENFTADRDWMPQVVLIAKSTLVYLDQLSQEYDATITRLDQIPDQELQRLAALGVNALWLIGLWERSPASRRIKHLTGNPDAEASAYSLLDYDIAGELGGWEALGRLREKAWQYGIRLASDMVPNHTGIDSRWMSEHPNWFIQTRQPPYPGYSYTGENLSQDPNLVIQLEDHYWDRSDAAVSFRREERSSGDVRYIYHGNDGTHLPWNDTGQLNFLDPAVRRAVSDTILHVARNFPIIRFDAAMVLARKHVQRLWYPLPGSGGGVPSRAEHALTQAEFDAAMPQEFWREVVDRCATEAPDTLLLAEAFWMMEGYFVRTLGMHRVYNSAFMNMLKDEKNAEFRQTIRNTLSFDPEILKRFVNFMSNPDEETARDQFGDGDKYFGVFTLMATLPGLPMIGHGQFEGYREKYGMEFRRAYRGEVLDQGLLEAHRRHVVPLLQRRDQFAHADEFMLYDLVAPGDGINENVIAYSNDRNGLRSLVVYNNAYAQAAGHINRSAPVLRRDGQRRSLWQSSIAGAFGLSGRDDAFCILREQVSGLTYLYPSGLIQHEGLYLDLSGYERRVYLDIYEDYDRPDRPLALLWSQIGASGCPDLEAELRRARHRPLLNAWDTLMTSPGFSWWYGLPGSESLPEPGVVADFARRVRDLARQLPRTSDPAIRLAEAYSVLRTAPVRGDEAERRRRLALRGLRWILGPGVEKDDLEPLGEPELGMAHGSDPSGILRPPATAEPTPAPQQDEKQQ